MKWKRNLKWEQGEINITWKQGVNVVQTRQSSVDRMGGSPVC